MECTVKVEQGRLQGKTATDFKGGRFYSFQGIPYAKPPVGELRFKGPQPPEKWDGIRDATKEGNRSLSFTMNKKVLGSEDCLYLNIYTKKLPNKDMHPKLPVFFWIHGGGFMTGTGNSELFGPDFLLTEEIILVTINYRLGLLGFLSFEDPSFGIPGNSGMKDISQALQWTYTNINAFGGDNARVTVGGESAGGAAAHLLAVSPMTRDLIAGVIAQSGTALSQWALTVRRACKFASAIANCDVTTEEDAYDILRYATGEQLLIAADKVVEINDKLSFRILGPIVELKNSYEPTFLPEKPITTFTKGQISHVPLLIGHNDADGMLYATETFKDRTLPFDFTDSEDLILPDMGLQKGSEKSKEIARKIKQYYYGHQEPSSENIDTYIKLQTDIKFNLGDLKSIKSTQAVSDEHIYFYTFSVDTPSNLYKKFTGLKLPGAAHGDELTFLFKTSYPLKFLPGSLEDKTRHRMVKLWTNFIKTNNPNPIVPDQLIEVQWKPVQNGKMNHIDIGEEITSVEERPQDERMKFWDEIYEECNSLKNKS